MTASKHLADAPHRTERTAACVGLIADTHMPQRWKTLPSALFDVLEGVDLLLHAGDVGELWVLDRLSTIAPVIAVHGNDDTEDAQRELPYQQVITAAGQRILLCHSHHPDRAEEMALRRLDAWGPKLDRWAALGAGAGAAVVVFGHTHVPMVREHEGVLLVNPGAIASGNATTRQRRQTVALLFVGKESTPKVTHVDLAQPDRPYAPPIDWEAGFAAALEQYSESILAPDLAAVWAGLYALVEPFGLQPYDSALLRASHRVWSGEQPAITRSALLSELAVETTIPSGIQAQLRAILSGKGP